MSKESKSKKTVSGGAIGVAELNALIDALDGSTVEEISVSRGEANVKIIRTVKPKAPKAKPAKDAPAPAAAPVEVVPVEVTHDVISPGVGIFLRAKDEKSDAFVKLRDMVTAGQVVGTLKFMGIKHEIRSEAEGKIVEILVEDGQAVEYGQPIFRLK
ncbi:MAG: biotin/lipoyl-binding protein [Spirochaetes bacterium]|nr:biotin/lipoyl-binding protein [Spirochaetota bacterium]